jgi:hypothetical protein
MSVAFYFLSLSNVGPSQDLLVRQSRPLFHFVLSVGRLRIISSVSEYQSRQYEYTRRSMNRFRADISRTGRYANLNVSESIFPFRRSRYDGPSETAYRKKPPRTTAEMRKNDFLPALIIGTPCIGRIGLEPESD